MKELAGPYAPLLTPFSGADFALDEQAWPSHLQFLAKAGLRGVLALGTQSEFYSLSFAEKIRSLELIAQHRQNLKLIAGIGSTCLRDAQELAKHAEKLSYDALLVLPPFYPKGLDREGMLVFFEKLRESSPLPMLYYHIPQNTGVDWNEDWIDSLCTRIGIRGLKDSSASAQSLESPIVKERRLSVFVGNDRLILQGLRQGALGSITALANVFPEFVVSLYREWEEGEGELEQQKLSAIRDLDATGQATAGLKAMLEMRGLSAGHCRPPLLNFSDPQKLARREELRRLGVLV